MKSSTESLPSETVRIIKKQAIKASGSGPKCKQQMKKHLLKKT